MTVAADVGATPSSSLRRSGAEVRVDGSEAEVLWEKLARQARDGRGHVDRTAADRRAAERPGVARAAFRQAIDEACAVAAADGVTLSPQAEWEIIESMPPLLTSSTARDIAAGVPSELDAITGAVVRAGRRLGVATPMLAQMLDEEACRASSR